MARMLMNAAQESLCDRDDSHRTEQRMREKRAWRAQEEVPEGSAPLDPFVDLSDCRHGCGGGGRTCLEICGFTCHPGLEG